jgi:hypothetical protein
MAVTVGCFSRRASVGFGAIWRAIRVLTRVHGAETKCARYPARVTEGSLAILSRSRSQLACRNATRFSSRPYR